jgi:hypothetical protein
MGADAVSALPAPTSDFGMQKLSLISAAIKECPALYDARDGSFFEFENALSRTLCEPTLF